MQSKFIVCTTGFKYQQDQQKIIQCLGSLKCNHVQQMKQQTNLLVVNCAATQKYKIANLRLNKVPCVTQKWLLQSKNAKKILPLQKYKIPTIFYGVRVGIAGFVGNQLTKIEGILKNNGAKIFTLTQQLTLPTQDTLSCILINEEKIGKYKFSEELAQEIPFVGLDWLQLSLKRQICKFPKDYAYNYQILKKSQKQKQISLEKYKLNKKLNQLTNQTLLNQEDEYLEDVIIYIDQSVDSHISEILKKIISARGGLYVSKFTSIVTHILLGPIIKESYEKYLKYGNIINLVRVWWLIDSIYIDRRMYEQDYQLREAKVLNILKLEQNRSINLSFLKNHGRNSISVPKIKKNQSKSVKKVSNIFKGFFFYLQPSQKKQKELIGLGFKIKQHGGNLWEPNSSLQIKHFYLVMNDSPDNKQIYSKYKSNKQLITQVSYRWINYCIASSSFIPHDKIDYFTFRPFNIKTPNPQFLTYRIEILCSDDILKRRIRQVLSVLGVPVKNNLTELTHCLCQEDYKEMKKFKEIKNVNSKVQFVKYFWLLECIGEGCILNTQNYLEQ